MRNSAGFNRAPSVRDTTSRRFGPRCINCTVLLPAIVLTALAWSYLLHFSVLSSNTRAGLPVPAENPARGPLKQQLLQAQQQSALQAGTTAQKYRVHVGIESSPDNSKRCAFSGICDGPQSATDCGEDGLGCITSAFDRQAAIKKAMTDSWNVYRRYAWGHDELRILPDQHHTHMDWLHQGLTIVDALDTLLIMNMSSEYQAARDWAVHKLHLKSVPGEVSVFETNIRVLGGLLSAYTLTGSTDKALLRKAKEVADALMPAFDSQVGVPHVFFHPGHVTLDGLPVVRTNLAAAGSFSLELATISRLTGTSKYMDASNKFWDLLEQLPACDGLYCTWFSPEAGACIGHNWEYSFGASSDSFYEYMLKQWILTHGRDTVMLERYKAAIAGMRAHLVLNVIPCTEQNGSDGTSTSIDKAHSTSTSTTRRQLSGHTSWIGPDTAANKDSSGTSLWEQPFWIVGFGRRNPMRNKQCPVSYHAGGAGAQFRAWFLERGRGLHSGSRAARALQYSDGTVNVNAGRMLQQHRDGTSNLEAGQWQGGSKAGVQSAQHTLTETGAGVVPDILHQADRIHHLVPHRQRGAEMADMQVQSDEAGRRAAIAEQAEALEELQAHVVDTVDGLLQQHAAGLRGQHHDHDEAHMISGADIPVKRRYGDGDDDDEELMAVPAEDLVAQQAAEGLKTSWFQARAHVASEAVTPERRLQHFTCFVPGLLALGHMHKVNTVISPKKASKGINRDRPAEARTDDDLLLAAKLMRGCYELYRGSVTGVAGDVLLWEEQQHAGTTCHVPAYVDAKNYLRPEVVESLFYLWRATHDPVYRQWGWQMFRALHQHSRLPSGAYATLEEAVSHNYQYGDRQESFWLAETLKYFYLLFSDDSELLPLDKWVFNTEAHPLPVWT